MKRYRCLQFYLDCIRNSPPHLGILIISLRGYYKDSPDYKHVYSKQSFDNWEKSIKTLVDWQVIQDKDIEKKYNDLADFRRRTIHFDKLENLENKALEVLKIIFDITIYFFDIGKRKDIYLCFDVPGEIYVKREAELTPFVKQIIPSTMPFGRV